jgi:cysteine desulfurase
VFTASGTIAAQIALRGIARARRGASRRIVLSRLEHPAIDDAASALAEDGFDVVRVPPAADGSIDEGTFLDAVGRDAAVAALILANHETGIRMPVSAVGAALRARGIPFVCDACLGPGREDVRSEALPVDVLTLSGHKFGGPRGTGLLYVRRRTPLFPLFAGGPQEERVHPGTENVAGAAGLVAALEVALAEREPRAERYAALLARMLDEIDAVRPWHRVGGEGAKTLPGMVTLELPGVEGEAAMINLDLMGVAVSTGSACAMGAVEPSPSLVAMGYDRARAARTIRISFGEGITNEDATNAGRCLATVVDRLRSLGRS